MAGVDPKKLSNKLVDYLRWREVQVIDLDELLGQSQSTPPELRFSRIAANGTPNC